MLSNPKTPWLALAAISFFTAYGLWQIAIRQPGPIQVRFIDLPQATPAALLTSGIDRQTLSEYLELKTTVSMGSTPSTASTLSTSVLPMAVQKEVISPVPAGGTKRPALYPPVQIKTREKRDGHSRAPQVGQWVKVEISTYSRSYHGNGTHSGERYDHYRGHTAATTIIRGRWVLPKGSTWEVEYLGQTITVRINDTGSWRPKKAPYWLDLSGSAWRDLTGIAPSRKVGRMRRVR